MLPDARSSTELTGTLRRRSVPTRTLGSELVVARPRDGAPVVLAPVATIVWRLLADRVAPLELERRLATDFPTVPPEERAATLAKVLETLEDNGLLERG